MTKPFDRSFTDPEIVACPFAVYGQLQREAPIYRDPVTGWYEVTRFEDIRRIAADHVKFSSNSAALTSGTAQVPEIQRLYEEEGFPPVPTLITNDPPVHRKFRSLVDKAFGVNRVAAVEPQIEKIIGGLIDGFIDRPPIEFMSEFAIPVPVIVIAEVLGVPNDRAMDFKRWSDALMLASDVTTSAEQRIAYTRDIIEMHKFFAAEIEAVRKRPNDKLLSALTQAEIDGEKLTMQELVHTLQSLLVAGNETTTNALGNAIRMLIEQPALTARLRADLSLVPNFVEESLRYIAPLQALFRRATEDVVVNGFTIPKDSTIALRWGAAGRDATWYDRPEELMLDRKNITQHLTFGFGIHYCLGNQLARVELRIGFREILRRLGNLRFADAPDAIVYQPSYIAYGPRRLLIMFDKLP